MTLLFLGTTEIIIIAAVVLLLFGGAKLPELMRGLGKGIREFKDASREVKKEINLSLTLERGKISIVYSPSLEGEEASSSSFLSSVPSSDLS